jgi:hypothetical protein
MVLNRVIRPPWEKFGDLHPLIAQAGVGSEKLLLLCLRPSLLLDVGVELVEPPLTTL